MLSLSCVRAGVLCVGGLVAAGVGGWGLLQCTILSCSFALYVPRTPSVPPTPTGPSTAPSTVEYNRKVAVDPKSLSSFRFVVVSFLVFRLFSWLGL